MPDFDALRIMRNGKARLSASSIDALNVFPSTRPATVRNCRCIPLYRFGPGFTPCRLITERVRSFQRFVYR